jgi:hypothetical protein
MFVLHKDLVLMCKFHSKGGSVVQVSHVTARLIQQQNSVNYKSDGLSLPDTDVRIWVAGVTDTPPAVRAADAPSEPLSLM